MAGKITISGRKFARRVSAGKQNSAMIVAVHQQGFLEIINQWPAVTERQVELISSEVSLLAQKEIKNRTPVLSGFAQRQWFRVKLNRFAWLIGNNTPYIRRLEHGWSKKSKEAMVRFTETLVPGFVADVVIRMHGVFRMKK